MDNDIRDNLQLACCLIFFKRPIAKQMLISELNKVFGRDTGCVVDVNDGDEFNEGINQRDLMRADSIAVSWVGTLQGKQLVFGTCERTDCFFARFV